VVWILHCKLCKFGEKIFCNSRDQIVPCRLLFIGTPRRLLYKLSTAVWSVDVIDVCESDRISCLCLSVSVCLSFSVSLSVCLSVCGNCCVCVSFAAGSATSGSFCAHQVQQACRLGAHTLWVHSMMCDWPLTDDDNDDDDVFDVLTVLALLLIVQLWVCPTGSCLACRSVSLVRFLCSVLSVSAKWLVEKAPTSLEIRSSVRLIATGLRSGELNITHCRRRRDSSDMPACCWQQAPTRCPRRCVLNSQLVGDSLDEFRRVWTIRREQFADNEV